MNAPLPITVPERGCIVVSRVNGRSLPTTLFAKSPMVLLSPKSGGEWAWVMLGSLGGGLLSGDMLALDVHVAGGARLLLGSQASTKIYRAGDKGPATQQLHARVEAGAILAMLPDPIVPFAKSGYAQCQSIRLDSGAGLVLLDWFTSGRHFRGERWQMTSFCSTTDILVDGKPLFRDALRLDPVDGGPLAEQTRMGRFDGYATLALVGPPLAIVAEATMQWLASAPLHADDPVVFSAAPMVMRHSTNPTQSLGLVIRAAGRSMPALWEWIRQRLAFLSTLGTQLHWDRRG